MRFPFVASTLVYDGVIYGEVSISRELDGLAEERKKAAVILLADESSSMSGVRNENLKKGVQYFVELQRRFAGQLDLQLGLITYNETAREVLPVGPIPDNITEIINRIKADGATSIKRALSMAMSRAREQIEKGINTFVVLLTDGEDYQLLRELSRSADESQLVADLSSFPLLSVFSVGICQEASKDVLEKVVACSRRGAVQIIEAGDIARLIGAVFALVVENEALNVTVQVTKEGEHVRCKEVLLSNAAEKAVVHFKTAVQMAQSVVEIKVTVADSDASTLIVASPLTVDDATPSLLAFCVDSIHANAMDGVQAFLRSRNFAGARGLIAEAKQSVGNLLSLSLVEEGSSLFDTSGLDSVVSEAVARLQVDVQQVFLAEHEQTVMAMFEMRLQSDASTRMASERNNSTMSIDVTSGSRTLSVLQRSLSDF